MSAPRSSHSTAPVIAFGSSSVRRQLRQLLALALLLVALSSIPAATAAGIVVTTTADTLDAACAEVTIASLPGADGATSLREAVCAANNAAGADMVTFSIVDSTISGNTVWSGFFAAGTTDLYVYADSRNPGVASGAVGESNESNNRAHLGGLTVTGPNP